MKPPINTQDTISDSSPSVASEENQAAGIATGAIPVVVPNALPGPDAAPLVTADTILPALTQQLKEEKARELHAAMLENTRKSVSLAYEIGGILEELKANVPYGQWERYVDGQLGIHPRSASNYMRIWRQINSDNPWEWFKSESVSDIGTREMLDFLAEKARHGKDPAVAAGKPGRKPDAVAKRGANSVELADGRRIRIGRSGGIGSLIGRDALARWVEGISAAAVDRAPGSHEARRQQAVVAISAAINRTCGHDDRGAAIELVEAALQTIRELLSTDVDSRTGQPAGATGPIRVSDESGIAEPNAPR